MRLSIFIIAIVPNDLHHYRQDGKIAAMDFCMRCGQHADGCIRSLSEIQGACHALPEHACHITVRYRHRAKPGAPVCMPSAESLKLCEKILLFFRAAVNSGATKVKRHLQIPPPQASNIPRRHQQDTASKPTMVQARFKCAASPPARL